MKKRLLGMLLAIVMVLSMATPVLAVENTEEPYAIMVDGTMFYSDLAAEGENWTYDPEHKVLVLEDYRGAEIISSGSIAIYTYGENDIEGQNYYGVAANGAVSIFCVEGSLTISGGAALSGEHGYAAVYSLEEITCFPAVADSTITLIGGYCNQRGYYGGDALHAPVVFLMGCGQINATGGDSKTPSEFGGYAVYADELYVGVDCSLKGGSGYYVTQAVCINDYCSFGHVNASLEASSAGLSAFDGEGDLYIKFANYTRTDDYSKWTITPRTYTLTLDGAGGTMNEQTSVVLTNPFTDYGGYPDTIKLSSYSFTRSGYQQTGWQTPDGATLPLDAAYEPPFDPYSSENTNITLTAVWEPVAVQSVPMFRMYDPNSGEHFYTGSEEERDNLVNEGWNYEGVAFNFPAAGAPVYRLYDDEGSGDHLYTMDQDEIARLVAEGWNNEGVAFNSASDSEVAQYRLYNPNAHLNGERGAWHFTSSEDERNALIAAGWQDQGIGWYSALR